MKPSPEAQRYALLSAGVQKRRAELRESIVGHVDALASRYCTNEDYRIIADILEGQAQDLRSRAHQRELAEKRRVRPATLPRSR